MAVFLFVWELGEGLGHLTKIPRIIAELQRRGHRAVLVSRNVSSAHAVFAGMNVPVFQAPRRCDPPRFGIKQAWGYSEILHNNGFSHAGELAGLVEAWSNLYSAVRPDVMLFDHSPVALLAARGYPAKRVVLGTGFEIPPAGPTLPQIRRWKPVNQPRLDTGERHTRNVANEVLTQRGVTPLARLSDVYGQVDDTLFLTLPELDHFGERPGVRYWGSWAECEGVAPEWPSNRRPRVFAYLKPSPTLRSVLELLSKAPWPSIVYGSWVTGPVRREFESASLRLESRPVDFSKLAGSCDVAIGNGTHGTTLGMLLAGIPMLLVPIHVEQILTGLRVREAGAGLMANRMKIDDIRRKLRILLRDRRFRERAAKIALKYANRRPEATLSELVDRLESLVGGPARNGRNGFLESEAVPGQLPAAE